MAEGPGLGDRELRLLVADRQIGDAARMLTNAVNLLARCKEDGLPTEGAEKTVELITATLESMRIYRDLLAQALKRDERSSR